MSRSIFCVDVRMKRIGFGQILARSCERCVLVHAGAVPPICDLFDHRDQRFARGFELARESHDVDQRRAQIMA